jgi:hypothetical protein
LVGAWRDAPDQQLVISGLIEGDLAPSMLQDGLWLIEFEVIDNKLDKIPIDEPKGDLS